MKNPDEKVNIEAFGDTKKLHLAGGGGGGGGGEGVTRLFIHNQ